MWKIKELFRNVRNRYIQRQIRKAHLNDVVLGPELNRNFEVRHPENLYIGKHSVLSGDCFINALGGGKNWF